VCGYSQLMYNNFLWAAVCMTEILICCAIIFLNSPPVTQDFSSRIGVHIVGFEL
jgi:hypothetical protein